MIKSLKVIAALVFFGQAGVVFAGGPALSQLPGIDGIKLDIPVPGPKSNNVWVNFRINGFSSSFSFDDYSQGIQVNGYKDFDSNVRFSGRIDDKNFFGSLTRDFNGPAYTFELGDIRLTVERYAIHYKVTGTAAGVPVNMTIRGAIRERAYAVSYKGLELTSRKEQITGTVDPSCDKTFATAIASIMAALQTEDVLGVVETALNYPNPFVQNNGTTLTYTLLQQVDYVKITVYDMYGKVLKELDGGTYKGENRVFWDGRDEYNSGGTVMGRKIYIWQLEITQRGSQNRVIRQFKMDAVNR